MVFWIDTYLGFFVFGLLFFCDLVFYLFMLMLENWSSMKILMWKFIWYSKLLFFNLHFWYVHFYVLEFFLPLPKCIFQTTMFGFIYCFFWLIVFLTFVLVTIRPTKGSKSKWKTGISSRRFQRRNMIVFYLVSSLQDQCWIFFLACLIHCATRAICNLFLMIFRSWWHPLSL